MQFEGLKSELKTEARKAHIDLDELKEGHQIIKVTKLEDGKYYKLLIRKG